MVSEDGGQIRWNIRLELFELSHCCSYCDFKFWFVFFLFSFFEGGRERPGWGAQRKAGVAGKGRGGGLRGRPGRGARDCPMLYTPQALNAPLTRLL